MQYPLEQNWTIDNYTVNGGFDQQHPYGPQTQNDDDNASGILMFYMWMILYFILIRREGQMELAHEEVELQRQQRGGREESEEDSAQRKARIEKSLMVKQVLENTDAQGRQRLGELSSIENKDTAQHVDSQTQEEGDYDEDDSQCCVICLEPFRTGDIVAWGKPHNSSTPCSHVFHRDCIHLAILGEIHGDLPTNPLYVKSDSWNYEKLYRGLIAASIWGATTPTKKINPSKSLPFFTIWKAHHLHRHNNFVPFS